MWPWEYGRFTKTSELTVSDGRMRHIPSIDASHKVQPFVTYLLPLSLTQGPLQRLGCCLFFLTLAKHDFNECEGGELKPTSRSSSTWFKPRQNQIAVPRVT